MHVTLTRVKSTERESEQLIGDEEFSFFQVKMVFTPVQLAIGQLSLPVCERERGKSRGGESRLMHLISFSYERKRRDVSHTNVEFP